MPSLNELLPEIGPAKKQYMSIIVYLICCSHENLSSFVNYLTRFRTSEDLFSQEQPELFQKETMLARTIFRAADSTCVVLCLLLLVLLDISRLSECYNRNSRGPVAQRPLISNKRFRQQIIPNNVNQFSSQQRQMRSDEYEKLSKNEQKALNDNNEEQSKLVYPSKETNGNSQVVYVNWGRVIKENSKNETTRVVDNNQILIKQDTQIACGETNRNGVPSLVTPNQPTEDPLPNRIVGGTKAEPGEFPFQVRLNIRSRRGSSLCGGVIIDQRHILTAAHCMTTW